MNLKEFGRKYQKLEKETPEKAKGFLLYCMNMMDIVSVGTSKYTGSEKDKWETIDIIPKIIGEDEYIKAIMGYDLVKRIIRYINQRRERDLFKIGVWCYLLYQRYHTGDKK